MEDTDFIRALRSALNNLYEPDQLRANPLSALLGFEGRVDAPAALAEAITDAIESIRDSGPDSGPDNGTEGDGVANPARAWLAHDVLHYRYVRGYSREEVARKLNISDRQLSRELRSALELLAVVLWRKHPQAHGAAGAEPMRFTATPHDEPTSDEVVSEEPTMTGISDGATWLADLPVESPAGWREVLESVLLLMQPLMERHGVFLQIRLDATLANLFVAQNALRQTLLLLLGWFIPLADHSILLLHPSSANGMLILRWRVEGAADVLPDIDSALEIPRQLLAHRGGSLEIEVAQDSNETGFTVVLTVPALAQVPVLVIDDNQDTIQLFLRYVQGTRYALVGVSNPDEVSRALERVQPRIILLDVMMPQVDGWDMLARLRQLPEAQHLSIIVCSIMPLESVARSLGASGFLQKPVLPQALLQTLDLYAR